jgi:HEAT repeat protein
MTLKGREGHAKKGMETGNPLANGKKPPTYEGISKEKLAKFRELITAVDYEKADEIINKSPENVIIITMLLSDEDATVRRNAAWALLGTSAEKGTDITAAIPALVIALDDRDIEVREGAIKALGSAVGQGAEIDDLLPVIANALDDRHVGIRRGAGWALKSAAKGADITAAIPALVNALCDEDIEVREFASSALKESVSRRDQTRTLVVNEIIRLMQSDLFQSEMWRNSMAYERTAVAIADILDKIKNAEATLS